MLATNWTDWNQKINGGAIRISGKVKKINIGHLIMMHYATVELKVCFVCEQEKKCPGYKCENVGV